MPNSTLLTDALGLLLRRAPHGNTGTSGWEMFEPTVVVQR